MEYHQFTDPQTNRAFLDALATANWGGIELLHPHLTNGTFNQHFGDSARAFYATDNGKFVGCINIAEQDYIPSQTTIALSRCCISIQPTVARN